MSAKIYTFTPTASAGKVNDLGSRVAVLENENPVKSVNAVEPDENGNVNISTVDYAYGIASDDAQSSDGTFICRTTGGSASLADGSAWLATLRGRSVHTGYVTESLDMTVNQAEREQGEEHTDVGISATIDRDTFVSYVTSSRTVTLTHNGTAWSADPALYGITVIGTPIANDKIVVVYVKEDRGTIINATPTAFVSTGWNIYDHSKGYARAVKYDDNAVFGISGAYSALKFSSSISGTKSNITVTNGRFTVPEDGYIWVTGGNNTTTAIWMTWSDWTDGYEGEWEAYRESIINFAPLPIFENGMCSVGGVADTMDFDLDTVTSNIERLDYSAQNLATVIASGRAYDCDRNYIYVVRETPVTQSFSSMSAEYIASDHGLEFFLGTEVGCYVSMLYGRNLVEYLKHDVPEQISNLSTDVSTLRKGLAIIADGNTHARVESGQFVDVRNHSSLADGLYSAKTAIEVNGSLSTSNLKAESLGGLNALNSMLWTELYSKLWTESIYLKHIQPIAANTDLDDVQEPGTYVIDSASIAQTLGHYPEIDNGNGKLIVNRNTGNLASGWWGNQILISGYNVCLRVHYGSVWDVWNYFGESHKINELSRITFASGFTPVSSKTFFYRRLKVLSFAIGYDKIAIPNETKLATIPEDLGVWGKMQFPVYNYTNGKPINGSVWVEKVGSTYNMSYFGDDITSDLNVICSGTWIT